MKKLAILFATLTFSGSAFAADMATKLPVNAPAPAFGWTGLYIGINGGGAWDRIGDELGNATGIYTPTALGVVLQNGNNTINESGGIAGGQVGYLLQQGSVVAGIEASFDWSGINKSITTHGVFGGAPFVTFNDTAKSDWMGLFLARVGLVSGGWFPYVTGGVAVAQLKYASSFADVINGISTNISMSKVAAAPAFGVGLEYKVDNHWSVRGEWLYTAFGNFSGSSVLLNPGLGTSAVFQHSVSFNDNIGRVALSYKF